MTLRNLVGDAVFLHSGREHLKAVAPGDARVVEFDLEVKKLAEDGIVKLQLSVADAKIGASVAEKLCFPLAASTVTFAAGSGHVLAGGAIDLYASPLPEQQQKVARAEAGSALKVLGVADGWYRVELDSKRLAFARAGDVKPGSGAKPKLVDVLAVSPPKITLIGAVTHTDSDRVHISGTATDDEAVRDVYISVYNPSRNLFGSQEKVFYQAAADPKTGRLEFAADIPLTPGRVDDVLKVSGHRLGTAEVESTLVSHPAVAEAAAIGLPHDIKGQGIYTFVMLRAGQVASPELAEELRQHVATHMGPIARPEEVRFVDKLPKTRSGKIMRRVLEARAQGLPEGDISTIEE